MPKRKPNDIVCDGDVARIIIESRTYGHLEALIDVADVPLVRGRRWTAVPAHRATRTVFYVSSEKGSRRDRRTTKLHRLLCAAEGLEVDHINGDPLDNRRCNLRAVTHQHNQWNRTQARGTKFCAHTGKFVAQIGVDQKKISLGYFKTEEEAHRAYLDAKTRLHVIPEVGGAHA